jgi:methionyl-tRNA formyltransferase
MSLKIVFMGTPEFSVPALEILIKNKLSILNVYTQPPAKSNRGRKIKPSRIQQFCNENKIDSRCPKSLNTVEEYEYFKKLSPDCVIVVAYGKLIPKKFLNLPKFGFINIHASLLPRWRGAAPIQRAIMNGDKTTGVSIMKVEEALDSGPVLATKKLELNQDSTYSETEKKLSKLGADLLIESLNNIEAGKTKFLTQVHSEATYAKKINKNETKINWELDANKIISHIHGLSTNPGAWFEYENERFKVLRVKKSQASGSPGIVLDENLTVGCKSGSIQILEIQREGKNKQNIKDFLRGKKISKDSILI